MLVLSRRPSEQIVIPDLGITLKVIAVRGNTVRLGIDAPSEVAILRGELVDSTSDDSHLQEASQSQHSSQTDRGTKECQPQPKLSRRSKKAAYGVISRTNGLQKYVQSVQSNGLNSAPETAVNSCDIEMAIEDGPHQVGEEPALYRISF